MIRKDVERLAVPGPAGRIEVLVDHPARFADEGALESARGIAVVAHPHPLFGGTAENKVVQTLARTFAELGYVSLRPNFRGVGGTEGKHDHGEGETDDLARVVEFARDRYGSLPVVLAGFSFGGFVQTRLARRIAPERMVLVGMANGTVSGVRHYEAEHVPPDTIVIHGEHDTTVPLANVLEWARPQELPIVLVPNADHFFHRRLGVLKQVIKSQWR
jgi:alpha/beta superfamily hydrolase